MTTLSKRSRLKVQKLIFDHTHKYIAYTYVYACMYVYNATGISESKSMNERDSLATQWH